MSMELHVMMHSSKVPTVARWQKAIEELGFSTILPPDADLHSDSGYWPVRYQGEESGFEFYLEDVQDTLETYPHIEPALEGRDTCATFCLGGDMTECEAAMTACAALCQCSEGIYYFPDDDQLRSAVELLEATRRELADSEWNRRR